LRRFRAEEYREKALACERTAKGVTDPVIRQQWEELVIQWHFMASQAMRLRHILKNAAPK
jgi:hypothetical protein